MPTSSAAKPGKDKAVTAAQESDTAPEAGAATTDTEGLSPAPQVPPQGPPEPTSLVHQAWFPASVRLPDTGGQAAPRALSRQLNNVKVFATDAGLFVFDRAPDPGTTDTPEPVFFSPIDFAATGRPPTGMRAANGVHITTDAGRVTIMATGGCGCRHAALRAWTPTWASVSQSWPEPGNAQ